MKIFSDKDDGILLFEKYHISCIPTTEEEKEFIKNSTDENGNVKPSIYDKLYKYRDDVSDNIFHYPHGYCEYVDDTEPLLEDVESEAIMSEVERLRDKEEDKWGIELLPIPKPSTLCLVDLFYTINHDYKMVNKITDDILGIIIKEKENQK